MNKKVKVAGRRSSRVSSKNQITIPVSVLRQAGVGPGDSLRTEATGPGEIALRRASNAVEEVAGSLTGVFPKNALEKLRSEWR
jgi:bifunctional DNA-binding transcriptional regulator/antitoxin component of YhaV-PrlF toxin-antitoxin module